LSAPGVERVVFVGPTLPADEVTARLPGAAVRGPAEQGSVLDATVSGVRAIGLIDGCFHAVPAVWHKEVLWALQVGVRVVGAASMGALRAAELDAYGMVGVGEIYRAFAAGELDADDEVAVLHGTAESGYRPMSEPLVNIKYTLARAVAAGVISGTDRDRLVELATSTFYAERHYASLIEGATFLPTETRHDLARWLPGNRVDQKRADALALLGVLAAGSPAPGTRFEFPATIFWARLIEDASVRPDDLTAARPSAVPESEPTKGDVAW
jgi:hypothetical protein